jgi:hypothetical protein
MLTARECCIRSLIDLVIGEAATAAARRLEERVTFERQPGRLHSRETAIKCELRNCEMIA